MFLGGSSTSSLAHLESPSESFFATHAPTHHLLDHVDADYTAAANESIGLLKMEKSDLVVELLAVQDNGK
jgi:hypothetical protein